MIRTRYIFHSPGTPPRIGSVDPELHLGIIGGRFDGERRAQAAVRSGSLHARDSVRLGIEDLGRECAI